MRKFKNGDRIYYTTIKSYGIILSCVNERDRKDRNIQGFRYIVKIGDWNWSIVESKLTSKEKGETK